MSEYLAAVANELPRDAVGMHQIVPWGRDGFGLTGAALEGFIGSAIGALLDAGAVPVKYQLGSEYDWTWQKQYGTTRADIIANVIAEWRRVPNDPMAILAECPWFARPRNTPGSKFVNMD